MGKSIKPGFIILALGLSLLAFQNCSGSGNSSQDETIQQNSAVLQGNGDGYGGKGIYVNYDLNNKCSSEPVNEESVIEIIKGKPYMTKQDCEPITPVEVSGLDIQEHNTFFGLDNNTLYQKQETSIFNLSEVFCRGSRFDIQQNHLEIADVYILTDGIAYTAKVKAGIYENGVLIQSRNIDDVPVTKNTVDGGVGINQGPGNISVSYQGVDIASKQVFTLWVHKPRMIGTLLSRSLDMTDPSIGSSLTPDELDLLNDILIIELLDCYEHD